MPRDKVIGLDACDSAPYCYCFLTIGLLLVLTSDRVKPKGKSLIRCPDDVEAQNWPIMFVCRDNLSDPGLHVSCAERTVPHSRKSGLGWKKKYTPLHGQAVHPGGVLAQYLALGVL